MISSPSRQRAGTWKLTALGCALLVSLLGCKGQITNGNGKTPGGPGDAGGIAYPFEPVGPRVYVNKVKMVLMGEPATEDEVQAVTADPTKLRTLIDGWFVTSQAQTKFFSFYQKAFQQVQTVSGNFLDQGGLPGGEAQQSNATQQLFLQNAQESFAWTVKKIVQEGDEPFTDTITTHKFMLTPPMMALILKIDQSDSNTLKTYWPAGFNSFATYYGHASTAADYNNALDPHCAWPANTDANGYTVTDGGTCYLHFPINAPFTCQVPQQDPDGHVQHYPDAGVVRMAKTFNEMAVSGVSNTVNAIFGSISSGGGPTDKTICALQYPIPSDVDGGAALNQYKVQMPMGNVNQSLPAATQATDWNSWKLVTIRTPQSGERPTPAWDLNYLRQPSTTEIITENPRVGFFTTPAFFANWQTNSSNQARVTMNQTLIGGIGRSINPVDKTVTTVLDDGKDSDHSDPNSPCYSCHQVMDPMRLSFLKYYGYTYQHQQAGFADPSAPTLVFDLQTFDFVFQGESSKQLSTMDDLAQSLINHPLYAQSWVQKLCYYANSAACSEDDPEFLRIAGVFKTSNYNFQAMVRELLSSPLVTGATSTKTLTDRGEVLSIQRQDHFCAALTNELNLPTNICKTPQGSVASITGNIPMDGYARGAEGPVIATDPSSFFRAAAEQLCNVAANATVDITVTAATQNIVYTSAGKDAAITDMVSRLMGITKSDPASAGATQILQDHYAAAVKAGANADQALKSTFVAACLSPSSLGMGM